MRRSTIAAVLLCGLSAGPSGAGATREGFEDAVHRVAENGMVVRGTVVEIPDERFPDPAGSRLLFKHQRVRIDACYFDARDACDDKLAREVTIPVPVGVRRQIDGVLVETQISTGSTAVSVNTFEVGQELVLFLNETAGGPEFYQVVPIQHGRRVIEDAGGRKQVQLELDRFDLLSDAGKRQQGNQARKAERETGTHTGKFWEAVPLDRLPELIEKARQRPPREPRRGPGPAPPR